MSDSTRFAERASSKGVNCQLEIYQQRWHVFHLQAFYRRSRRDHETNTSNKQIKDEEVSSGNLN
jgi:hypothetical protein